MATAKFTNGLTHTSMEDGHVWMIMTAMIAAALSICTLSFFICLIAGPGTLLFGRCQVFRKYIEDPGDIFRH